MARSDIELEIFVFSKFRDNALELGLQSAALKLTEEISARKIALKKLEVPGRSTDGDDDDVG